MDKEEKKKIRPVYLGDTKYSKARTKAKKGNRSFTGYVETLIDKDLETK